VNVTWPRIWAPRPSGTPVYNSLNTMNSEAPITISGVTSGMSEMTLAP
jgi:hypothetical protein